MNVQEVAPPGWGHTKAEKEKTDPSKPKSKIGGSSAAFKRALDDGRFKGLPGDKTYKDKKESMFKLMWAMKRKGAKPHYKPGTDKKYKKYQEEEVVLEKDLNAAERRALPDSDFALPGKGEGPKGKQAGSYPIPDEKHARSALSLVAQHGTPAEKATVRAKVKKKFPNIEQNESVVLDANTKIKKNEKREKDKKELMKLIRRYRHMKDMENPAKALSGRSQKESFEIDKSAHKKVQKQKKMRNLAIKNINKNEGDVAHRKAGGPKLMGESHSCPEGQYYCYDDEKCKPIPDGMKIGKDGMLVKEGAAWTKKAGKKESGGLNEKGRKSYERENPGSDLKAPSKKVGNKRRASFCARMKGMRKRQKPSNNTGDDRLSKSLRAWNCEYEPDGTTISEKNKSGDSSLHDWFAKSKSSDGKPGWVQAGGKFAGKPCAKQPGQVTKPKCISSKMKRNMSKDEEEAAHNRKQRQDPNPERSGKAKNVATEEKEMELKEYSPNVTYQAKGGKKSGKLGKSSVYSLRDKDESKKEFRKSQIKDIKGGYLKTEENLPVNEGKGEKDACYHKVKSRFKIWPSAYASGALVKCRKKGADNWGNSTKKEELNFEGWQDRAKEAMKRVAGKKKPAPHDYGKDAGKVARELMRKKDHQSVNFLHPDD